MKPAKMKKCRVCPVRFVPYSSLQVWCSPECAIIIAKGKRLAKERQESKAAKESIKTLAEWLEEAQKEFNAYIRERDHGLECISCNATDPLRWDAGHYRSRGAASHLRFNENNTQKQCSKCNVHLSSNAVDYRIKLVARIGLAAVEALENDNTPRRWTIDDAKRIKAEYRAKKKALISARLDREQ